MKDITLPIIQLTKAFGLMADTLKTVKEKADEFGCLLIKLNDKNFRKHNDAVNMVARLLKKQGSS